MNATTLLAYYADGDGRWGRSVTAGPDVRPGEPPTVTLTARVASRGGRRDAVELLRRVLADVEGLPEDVGDAPSAGGPGVQP